MRDGMGGEYAIVFSSVGAYVRGFDHESLMSPWARMDTPAVWPGVLDSVPGAFQQYVREPAFCDQDGIPTVTCCLWRGTSDAAWSTGTVVFPKEGDGDPDGADILFELLVDRSPQAYAAWATEYFEIPVDVAAVRGVFAQRPLTCELVHAIDPDVEFADLAEDISRSATPSEAATRPAPRSLRHRPYCLIY